MIEKFITALREEFYKNTYNKNLDGSYDLKFCVSFMMATIEQQIMECSDFINDISQHDFILGKIKYNEDGGHVLATLDIHLNDNVLDCYYIITFLQHEKTLGFCQCHPSMGNYNYAMQCCATECDWVAPAFKIEKVVNLATCIWEGLEREYWAYCEQHYKEDAKSKKLKTIQEYNNTIDSYNNEINKLQVAIKRIVDKGL